MNLPAVILASGKGSRMGGGKPLRLLGDKPLWKHVAERLSEQAAPIALNASDIEANLTLVSDVIPGFGPLSGIHAAMLWARELGAGRVLSVAVDTPFLPLDLATRLAEQKAPIVMASNGGRLHGTSAIWDVSLAERLAHALEAGTRKVTEFGLSNGASAVEFPDAVPPPFFNVNSQEDLAQAKDWLNARV